jgi:hypothetical protein
MMVKIPQRDRLNSISLNGFGLTKTNTRRSKMKAIKKVMAARLSLRKPTAIGSAAAIKPRQNDSNILWGTMVVSFNQFLKELVNPSVDAIDLPPATNGQDARFISNRVLLRNHSRITRRKDPHSVSTYNDYTAG